MILDLLITGGRVVFPKDGVRATDIGIKNEKIAVLAEPGQDLSTKKTIDVSGKIIMPGVIDAHEHLGIYNPVDEDFKDTMQHAVGGVTTIVNYDRHPKSYLETFPRLIEIGEENSYIDFSYSLGILKQQHLDELEETVKRFGLTSFKFFRNYERQLNDKFNIQDGLDLSSQDLYNILTQFKSISPKLLLGVHCENMDINRSLIKHYREADENNGLLTWSKTSPGYAEAESLLSTLYINKIVEGNIYIVHLTSGASVEVLENSKWLTESGVKVETCPHYLLLNEEHEVGLKAKVGPPIHTSEDGDQLWEGIKNGTIHSIGTDHVPNTIGTKFKKGTDTFDAVYGFPSAGALLPIMITEGYKKRQIPLERIADMMSLQIAKSFNLENKGRIEIGADADLAIIDLNKKKAVSPETTYSKLDYNVFDGMELIGWPYITISRGEVIVEKGKPVKGLGRGRYIRRSI